MTVDEARFESLLAPNQRLVEFIDEQAIQSKVKELATKINAVYGNENVILIGVLRGAFIFVADLIRHLTCPVEVEFMSVSSYEGTKSTGQVRINLDLAAEIQDKNVLLVEDIIDTGITIDYLLDTIKVRQPRSTRVCALFSKPECHQLSSTIDFVGFEIPNDFVVGYGMDYEGCFRQLPFLAKVSTSD